MNEWDQISQNIIRQTRTPAQGNRMNAGGGQQMQNVTSTMTDNDGYPRRLWIPGIDPWGIAGYYFGSRKMAAEELR